MDHAYVEEHDTVDAYLAGRLSEEDRGAFEAHYFDCETCLEHLEAGEGFREGMRQVAAEEIARAAAERTRFGLFAALATLSRWRRLALAVALFLLAVLPGFWLALGNRRLERQLAEATGRAAGAEQDRKTLQTRLRALEQAGAGDRQRLEEQLAEERQSRQAAIRPSQPQVNVPLFVLAAVRSGEAEGREPVNQIPLSSTTGSVILTAELATVDSPVYRASLRTAAGREVWTVQGLRPDSRDTLVLLLPASMLQAGIYRLTVEGAGKAGSWFAVSAYPFRVAPAGAASR